jgi:hypothetical protein
MGLVEDLSAAFVAFTIEVDDAAEARVAHSTTRGGAGAERGPWLVSLAMWENCLRWLPEDGISVAELIATARTPTNFAGMRRWGYIAVEGLPRGTKGRPRPEATVQLTKRGARAKQVWDGLPAEIEARWAERFGGTSGGQGADGRGRPGTSGSAVSELRAGLTALVGELDPSLPDTMPIVRHAWSTRREDEPEHRRGPVAVADLGLDSLLARPLTALALEYESTGKLSLALSANLLAVLSDEPTPLRNLPDAAGIQREQIDNAVGYLERTRLAEVVPTPGAKRGKSVALTETGARAKVATARKLAKLESDWDQRHGARVTRVREALAPFAGIPTGESPSVATSGAFDSPPHSGGPASHLLGGPEHPPGTWRAESKPLARLPRFPLVTHRGGFPDGA